MGLFSKESNTGTGEDVGSIVNTLGEKETTFRSSWADDQRYITNNLPGKAETWLQSVVATAGVLGVYVNQPDEAPSDWVKMGKTLAGGRVPMPGDFD